MPNFAQLKDWFVETWQEWNKDEAPRLGAALSFYTMLSLAPLLILLIAVAGLVFGSEAASGQLFGQIRDLVGDQGAATLQQMVQNANKPGKGIMASAIGFITLLVGASSVASELQYSLNRIFAHHIPDQDEGMTDQVKKRGIALAIVLGAGFLLLTSLAVSSAIAAAGKWFAGMIPLPEVVLTSLNFIVGLIVIAGVFAVLFHYMPDARPRWEHVWQGALFTSILFGIGKLAIGVYLGKASIGDTYGAAGSLVVVLVWVYYSAQLVFFGAEFTEVYARHNGAPVRHNQDKPAPASSTTKDMHGTRLPEHVAAGNSHMSGSPNRGDHSIGVLGTLIGSALAVTKLVRGRK